MPSFRSVVGACGVVLAGLGVVGCAQTRLIHPTASRQQVDMDNAQCEYEAARSAPLHRGGVVEIAFARNEMERLCLKSRGYREVSVR